MARQPVNIGSDAPEVALQGENGEVVSLSDLWAGTERGVVVAFLRHYG